MNKGLKKVFCLKCGVDDSRIVVTGKDYFYGVEGEYFASKCMACGLWFQNPRPSEEMFARLYPENYLPHAVESGRQNAPLRAWKAEYLSRRLGYTHIARDSTPAADWMSSKFLDPVKKWLTGVSLIPAYVEGGSLLEIGCARGDYLEQMKDMGWKNLYGIELSPDAAAQSRAKGLNVQSGMVEEKITAFSGGQFDVVVASMVFEHLANPFRTTEDVARILKPGGEFLFSTIIRDALDVKLYGKYWGGFDFPRHMVYFRKKDILDMLWDEFTGVRFHGQAAPVDFIRSSAWRSKEGKRNAMDALILKMGEGKLKYFHMGLAWLGAVCRVSVRCRKRAD